MFGRSIGSGMATHLAWRYSICALILMSAFTTLGDVVKEHVGIFRYLVKDRFKNTENLSKVKWPWIIIHGKKD